MKKLLSILTAASLFLGASAISPSPAQAEPTTIGFLVFDIVTETWALWFVEESMLIGGSAAATEGQIAALGADIMGPLLQAEIIPLGAEGGGAAAGAAGGTALGTVAILTGAVVVAVVATIGIDYAVHGNFFWEPVNEAGGFGIVLGLSPNPNLGANPSYTTVSCNPAAGTITDQCKRALGNNLTQYYTWAGGNYWTCGDMWNSSGSSNLWNQEIAKCNAALAQCHDATSRMCGRLVLETAPVATAVE